MQVEDDLPWAWGKAAALGSDVERFYWGEFVPLGRGHDFPYVNEAAPALLNHGRVVTALEMLSLYAGQEAVVLDPALIIEGLTKLLEFHDTMSHNGFRTTSFDSCSTRSDRPK